MADVKLPERLGEGFAGIDRFSNNTVGLNSIMNQVAGILAQVKAASQLTDFAAFKAAMASIDTLTKSDDSKV